MFQCSNENHKILQFDAKTGNFVKALDTGNELANPVGLAIDNQGHLLVSSYGNDQVLSYDVKSSVLVHTVLLSSDDVDKPTSLVVDEENNLYISSENTRILKYDLGTGELNEIKELTDSGKLEYPTGLALKNNELFVSYLV